MLTAIIPDDKKTLTITARNSDAICEFVDAYNSKGNLYYSPNPTRTTMSKKAAKTDIAAIEYLPADLDPADDETPEAAKARYLQQLSECKPAAAAVVDWATAYKHCGGCGSQLFLASRPGTKRRGS